MTAENQIPAPRKSPWMRTGAVVSILLLFGGVLIHHAARIPPGDPEYVALGSSFAAGPGDGEQAAGSYLPCFRSRVNYPHLFAEHARLRLIDVTCSGATSHDVLEGGQFFQPAQIDAVRETTKLVTVTIGGNDVAYLGNLGAWACANDPVHVPVLARLLGLCRETASAEIEEAIAGLPVQLKNIVDEVHRRAPGARVVLVDYADVLPQSGTCNQLRLSSQEADAGRELAMRLNAITAETAWRTDSGLVQASQLTRGHDVCSAQPWVFGFQFPEHLSSSGPVPFHPKAEAMQAIAAGLAEELLGSSSNIKATDH